jgi:hypothetical protein
VSVKKNRGRHWFQLSFCRDILPQSSVFHLSALLFLRQGFWAELSHHELLLYLFLTLVADRQGMSYYSFDKICSFLAISVDEYIVARNSLIDKDLIAFDGLLFQVLSLPAELSAGQRIPLRSEAEMKQRDPATINRIIRKSFANDEKVFETHRS